MMEHLQESQVPQLHFADVQTLRERVGPSLDRQTPVSGASIPSSWGN
jgi:hypothetical protein